MANFNGTIQINGPVQLAGKVALQGSKNSALSLIPTVLLARGESVLQNIPDLVDIRHTLSFMESLGISLEFNNNELKVDTSGELTINNTQHNEGSAGKIRTTYYFIPYLLQSKGKAVLPNPGGCALGERKNDFILEALMHFGATVENIEDNIEVACSKLKGANYHLPYPSQSASTILLSLAAIAEGESVLDNLSLNPEIEDKINLLTSMGARIEKLSPRKVVCFGGNNLKPIVYKNMYDRVAAGTWIAAAGITDGSIELPEHGQKDIETEIECYKKLGMRSNPADSGVRYYFDKKAVGPVSIETGPYPEFCTDIQPFITILAAMQNAWDSCIVEKVFDQRFKYVEYLNNMGMNIEVSQVESIKCPSGASAQKALINPFQVDSLSGKEVVATDLRAGMGLVLAGCASSGTTVIRNAQQIFRGYEDADSVLKNLGANITVTP